MTQPWTKRLEAIASLMDGWFDGVQGLATDPEVLVQLDTKVLPALHKYQVRVYMYPTLDGGVQLEWGEADVSFNPGGQVSLVLIEGLERDFSLGPEWQDIESVVEVLEQIMMLRNDD